MFCSCTALIPVAAQDSEGLAPGTPAGPEASAVPPEADATVPEHYRDIEKACSFTGRSLFEEGTREQIWCVTQLMRIRHARRLVVSPLPDLSQADGAFRRDRPLPSAAPAGPTCPIVPPAVLKQLQGASRPQCLSAKAKLQARANCESKQLKKVYADLEQYERDRKRVLPEYGWYNSHCIGEGKPVARDRAKCQSELPRLRKQTETFNARLARLESAREALEPALAKDSKLLAQASCNKGGKWSCKAKCQHVRNDTSHCNPPFLFGQASGPTEDSACRSAKRAATQSASRDCHARHCKCDCTKR